MLDAIYRGILSNRQDGMRECCEYVPLAAGSLQVNLRNYVFRLN